VSAFARSYAQAFLQASPPKYDVAAFLDQAQALGRALFSEQRVKGFFLSPSIPMEAKTRALHELGRRAGLDAFSQRFFELLLKRRRLADLAPILSAIRQEWNRKGGVAEALVTLAAPAGSAEQSSLVEALSRAVGQPVRLTVHVDGRILGGFIARIGSQLFDASVRSAIERFQLRASPSGRS
jgi:F-type H+-transporting ATPase subunit delta